MTDHEEEERAYQEYFRATIPPDPSPSPPAVSSKITQQTKPIPKSSLSSLSSPQLLSSIPASLSPSIMSFDSPTDPVRIRTINSATNNNSSSTVAVAGSPTTVGFSSSSTAPPPPPTTQHYPIPSSRSQQKSTEYSSYEDNVYTTRERYHVREGTKPPPPPPPSDYYHHQYGHGRIANYSYSPDEGVDRDYYNWKQGNSSNSPHAPQHQNQHHSHSYSSPASRHHHHHGGNNDEYYLYMRNAQQLPKSAATASRPSKENNAEIQKEQTNFVYGNSSSRGSVEQDELYQSSSNSPPYYCSTGTLSNNNQRFGSSEEDSSLLTNLRENNHHSSLSIRANSIQNNCNPSVQTIQKNTSTPLLVPSQNIPLYQQQGRRNNTNAVDKDSLTTNQNYHHPHHQISERNYQHSHNHYYQSPPPPRFTQFPSDKHHQATTGVGFNSKQTTASTNMQQPPFVIHPSMQPSSGIPPFHQVHSSSSFHVPSNYPPVHNQIPPHHQQQPQNNNYLNPQQVQQSYSSPNSNQANSSQNTEPKLRVYNSALKVPEGIFLYDGTTLTCEPHGFKPNDRRGAPQTTHSVYVSDVLVVSCELINMSNQPGVFQNCTARLVHLMGKNPKKKRKDGGTDDDGLDSEDDDMDEGKKKKKKIKKKDQEDSLDGDFMTDFSQAGMLESFELLSEQPCQENVQKGKIVSSLKVPRVRGRDCKTKTGQIQVLRFKGTEREHIIAVSDLFWIRSRTRTEMEVRKFKKQQQQTPSIPVVPSHQQPPENTNHQQPSHSIVPPTLNPPRESFHNPQWPNIVQPNSPSANHDAAGLPIKKRRNNSPGGNNTPNSYRATTNPAASIVHTGLSTQPYQQPPSSSHSYFSNNIMNIPPIAQNNLHQDDNKIPNHAPSHQSHLPFPPRNEPTYDELRQRVQMLEDKLSRLESKLMRSGHLSPDQPNFLSSPFLNISSQEPPNNSFTPFPIDVFRSDITKDEKRENSNPKIPSVVPTDSQPAIYNSKSPLPSYQFDSSDPFLKNGFSPSGLLNPTSSSSSESGKREHI